MTVFNIFYDFQISLKLFTGNYSSLALFITVLGWEYLLNIPLKTYFWCLWQLEEAMLVVDMKSLYNGLDSHIVGTTFELFLRCISSKDCLKHWGIITVRRNFDLNQSLVIAFYWIPTITCIIPKQLHVNHFTLICPSFWR